MIQYRKSWQNTARIARAIGNAAVCRTFMRSVLCWLSPADGRISTVLTIYRPLIDRLEMWWFAGISAP
jgi:hypothetical protein